MLLDGETLISVDVIVVLKLTMKYCTSSNNPTTGYYSWLLKSKLSALEQIWFQNQCFSEEDDSMFLFQSTIEVFLW